MTVFEFLLHETQIGELCVIRRGKWIEATVWIEDEGVFRMEKDVGTYVVKGVHWGTLEIRNQNGNQVKISCRYLDC